MENVCTACGTNLVANEVCSCTVNVQETEVSKEEVKISIDSVAIMNYCSTLMKTCGKGLFNPIATGLDLIKQEDKKLNAGVILMGTLVMSILFLALGLTPQFAFKYSVIISLSVNVFAAVAITVVGYLFTKRLNVNEIFGVVASYQLSYMLMLLVSIVAAFILPQLVMTVVLTGLIMSNAVLFALAKKVYNLADDTAVLFVGACFMVTIVLVSLLMNFMLEDILYDFIINFIYGIM